MSNEQLKGQQEQGKGGQQEQGKGTKQGDQEHSKK